MAGTDEQCDLETLTAMLDSEDENETNNQEDGVGLFDSSGDEDEDELDKLAALIEHESKHPELKTNNKESKLESGKTVKSIPSSTIVDKPVVEKDIQRENSGEMLDELRKMQERVRMLEAQLGNQSNGQKMSDNRSQSNKESGRNSNDTSKLKKYEKNMAVKPNQENVSTETKTMQANHGSHQSLKEIERNIFFDENQSQDDKPVSLSQNGDNKNGVKHKMKNDMQHGKAKENQPGHDSDSDWEDMEGEKDILSKSGQEIKSLLKTGERKRVAHCATYDMEGRREYQHKPTWKSKVPSSQTSTSSASNADRYVTLSEKRDLEAGITREVFSGIRLLNPLVSSTMMKARMESRKLIKMSRLHLHTNISNSDSDWVTVGVVVSKSDPKTSAKGSPYSIWRLSDLEDCERTVSLFLFGETHKQHWKTVTGMVVGLLNATVMPNKEKQSSEISLSIDNPQKIMMIGTSKDLGVCRSNTKAGRKCTAFINASQGEFCSYHVQAAYKKTSAKRSELQANFSGHVPRSFEKQIIKKGSTIMYGGESYSTSAPPQKKKTQSVSVKSIALHDAKRGLNTKAKVSTASLHNLLPEDELAMRRLKAQAPVNSAKEEKTAAFHEMLSTPSVGSMNLVKHLVKQEDTKKKKEAESKGQNIVSVSAKDMLKLYQKEMAEKRAKKQTQSSHKADSPKVDPLKVAPKLGRGFGCGDDIFLGDSPKLSRSAEKAKLLAIAKIKAQGGIKKEDPNEVSKKVKEEKTREVIRKRVSEQIMEDSREGTESGEQSPPKKRSRLLGDLDLDSKEVQKLLKAGSAHKGAQAEVEAERQELYFSALEKKEKMEDKMASITKQQCVAFSCKQCKYTALSISKLCQDENHNVSRHDAVKRFYKCKDCTKRTISLAKYPTKACSGCGGGSFERASMLQEKKAPKLAHEELLLRGEERKYVNS